jgi:hypothetical protein
VGFGGKKRKNGSRDIYERATSSPLDNDDTAPALAVEWRLHSHTGPRLGEALTSPVPYYPYLDLSLELRVRGVMDDGNSIAVAN